MSYTHYRGVHGSFQAQDEPSGIQTQDVPSSIQTQDVPSIIQTCKYTVFVLTHFPETWCHMVF